MADWIYTTLVSTAVSSVLVGLVVYLTQNLLVTRLQKAVEHEYAQKLATFQAKLKAESDIAQERLRAQLAIEASRSNLLFAKLHERRFEAIEAVYDKLAELYHAINDRAMAIFGSAQEDKIEPLLLAMEDFRVTSTPLLVFLPESLEGQIRTLQVQIGRMKSRLDQADSITDEARMSRWHEDIHGLLTSISAGFYGTKAEMRRLMGEPVPEKEDEQQ